LRPRRAIDVDRGRDVSFIAGVQSKVNVMNSAACSHPSIML
jgi:hypothetical protein